MKWFGRELESTTPTWTAPIGDFWSMRSAFAEGRPLSVSGQLPAAHATIRVEDGHAFVDLGGAIRRTIAITSELADEVDRSLRSWPAEVTVTVIDDGPESATLADQLRLRHWAVATQSPEPITVSLRWHEDEPDPDEDDDDELELDVESPGLHVGHLGAEGYRTRKFGEDAAAAFAYIATLRHVGLVKVEFESHPDVMAALSERMTAADIPWRRYRGDDVRGLSGPSARVGGLGLQFVVQGAGWMDARFELMDRCVGSWMSEMNDSWSDLLSVVAHVAITGGPAYCALLEEPSCKFVVVTPLVGGNVRLELRHVDDDFYGNSTLPEEAEELGSWAGPMVDLVTVVAGATRNMIDAAGLDGIEDGWSRPAPLEPLEVLDDWLRSATARG